MNKKGFTLVELITTFALTAVIITILVNISILIRNVYNKSEIKTQLLIEQANLSSALNTKINKKMLTDYSTCTDSSFCYAFSFSDGSVDKLIITNTYIKFGNYVYKLKNGTKVENPSVSKEAVSVTSSDSEFLVIKIPITNKLYPNENFGINIVYQYKLKYETSSESEQPAEPTETIGRAATESNKTTAGIVPKGNFEPGDEYIVNVDGTHEYHFYVLSTEGDKVNLITSRNICSDGTLATETNKCTVAWVSKTDYEGDTNYGEFGNNNKGPITAMNYLYEATKNWSNIENINMNYTDEGNTGDYGYGGITTSGNTTTITMKDGTVTATYNNLKARLPKYSETTGTECTDTEGSCPAWMVNGLEAVTSYYPTGTKEDISGIYGYWSLSSYSSLSDSAWLVFYGGNVRGDSVGAGDSSGYYHGVHPVITVLKSDLQ